MQGINRNNFTSAGEIEGPWDATSETPESWPWVSRGIVWTDPVEHSGEVEVGVVGRVTKDVVIELMVALVVLAMPYDRLNCADH